MSDTAIDGNASRLAQGSSSDPVPQGGRRTAEQGQAVSDGWRKLLREALREPAPNWQGNSTALAQSLAAAFRVPVLDGAEIRRIHALPVNTNGVESRVYLDRQGGQAFKRLATGTGEPSAGIWAEVAILPDGRLDYHYRPAVRARHLGIRLGVMTAIGGTPTEVHGIGPDGHIYLRQPLSPAPNIGRDPQALENDVITAARRQAGLVEIPSQFLSRSAGRVFVAVVHGRPWLITDLHADNFVGDNQGDARINDPVVGQITAETLARAPWLSHFVSRATQEADRLGDRSLRLFAANKVAPTPDDGNFQNDDLSNRPASDTRTDSPNSPGFIARTVLGADRTRRSQEPPRSTLQGNRAAIAEEYGRLLSWAKENGLTFDPSRLARELDARGEHRVFHSADPDSKRLFKNA